MLPVAEHSANFGRERVDAERRVVEAMALQGLVVALAAEQLDESIGIAALLAERGDLDAVEESLTVDHPCEVLVLVPELHVVDDRDRRRGIFLVYRAQIVGLR